MSVLSDEIDNDPTEKGYAALLANQPGHVVDLLNARTETMFRTRMITGRGILSDCGALGPSILGKLSTAAASNVAVEWAVKFLGIGDGLDVGHPATHAFIDQLVAGGVLTSTEGATLKNLSLQPASRAEVLGLPFITEEILRNR